MNPKSWMRRTEEVLLDQIKDDVSRRGGNLIFVPALIINNAKVSN